MAVTFFRLKFDVRVIYPWWSMMHTIRLKSKYNDSIEHFISDLTQKNTDNFNKLRKENLSRNQSQDEIINADLVEEIYNCLDSRDEEELAKAIDVWTEKRWNSVPRSVLIEILEFASSAGNTAIFQKITSYVKTNEPDFYASNECLFECLSLELDWKAGVNVDRLIDRFEVIHRKRISDDAVTKHVSRFSAKIINDTLERKGESAVIKLKDSIEKMCEKSQDYQLLFDLWRSLFESSWFSDQQLASELIDKHTPLRRVVSKQLSFLCFIYLRNNNTELVNRLIQIFLQFNMMKQVETLVKILFDFECWRRNMDAVLQIVQLCLKLDIQLTDNENKKFLDLLLNRKSRAEDSGKKKKKPSTKITTPKYQFKF